MVGLGDRCEDGGDVVVRKWLAWAIAGGGEVQVTLLTRGKAPITQQIPDDDEASYSAYKSAVQHAKADRKDADAMKSALSGQTFDGAAVILRVLQHLLLLLLLWSCVYVEGGCMPCLFIAVCVKSGWMARSLV